MVFASEEAAIVAHYAPAVFLHHPSALSSPNPTGGRNIDYLFIGAEAFYFEIGLRFRRASLVRLHAAGQRFAAQSLNVRQGGFDIVNLKADVIDAELQRLALEAGSEL